MQRHDLMALLGQLKLAGMRAHFDDVVTAGRKRQRSFEVILGELLRAEITDKQARSIRYQLGIAKLPLAKELTDFVFVDSPVNQALIDDLGHRRLPQPATKRRARRGHRDREDPSRDRHRSHLYPPGRQGALL